MAHFAFLSWAEPVSTGFLLAAKAGRQLPRISEVPKKATTLSILQNRRTVFKWVRVRFEPQPRCSMRRGSRSELILARESERGRGFETVGEMKSIATAGHAFEVLRAALNQLLLGWRGKTGDDVVDSFTLKAV